MTKSKLIKIGLPTDNGGVSLEWVWAKPLPDDQAVINSVVALTSFATADDVVKYDPQTMIVRRVVRRFRNTSILRYADAGMPAEKARGRLNFMRGYLEAKGVKCEGLVFGVLGLAVPVEWSVHALQNIIEEMGGDPKPTLEFSASPDVPLEPPTLAEVRERLKTRPSAYDREEHEGQSNLARARHAEDALARFATRNDLSEGEDMGTIVGDFLDNLLHLARITDFSFDDCLRRGRDHYAAECEKPPEPEEEE